MRTLATADMPPIVSLVSYPMYPMKNRLAIRILQMESRRYHTIVKLLSLTLVVLLATRAGQSMHAQELPRAQQEFEKLDKAYRAHQLRADQYMNKADSLVHQLLSEGKRFETNELVDLLGLYEEIAWSHPQYGRGRVSYHYLFFNNARMAKQKGASIYYAEKVAEAYKEIGEEHPLIAQLQLTKIYQELRLYDKVIAVFESERSYLESLPELLREGGVDNSVGLNAMYVLSPVVTGYIKLNDTASVHNTASLANQIGTILQSDDSLSRPQLLYNDMLMIDIEHSVADFERRYHDASQLLNRMEQLKTTYKDQATNFIDINLVRFRIENHKRLGNKDSLQYYIEQYASSPNFGKSQSADVSEFRADLAFLQGDYRGANEWLTDALMHERDLQANLMAESSDLLYAFTQAEHNAIALQRAEQVKQQRTIWMVIISSAASIVVLAIYFIMNRRNRRAKEQVEALNNMANMQIIAMEEAKLHAKREEQQRLGQDLHDGLSSSIASIKYQLEILSMDTEDVSLKNKLGTLQTEIAEVYETTRNKSHEWFGAAQEQQEQSFEQRIRLLTDSALPDSHYQKNIHIDDSSLQHIGADIRIVLLRIIQEAITNIIKHAKAKSIGILIYEENGSLQLVINDDGKGLGEEKPGNGKSKMGLQSIQRRVRLLNGQMTVQSSTDGTEIIVVIPHDASATIYS